MLEEFKNALNWTINIEYEGTNIAEPNTQKKYSQNSMRSDG